ncbi:MAG TPA: phenylalanine--tRNA ligase subunit beta [Actinomycetota bacterium]
MKVVLSWLREFAPTDLEADDLAELITQRGVKVEGVLRPWDGLEGVAVARVLDVADHPDSDKLCVARVDDGTGEQVVCAGVRNFAAGDLVPWAKPGSRVPVLPEPLAPRALRGVMSNGMLCSLRELNIADTHEGILVFADRDGLHQGDDVKTALGLDDVVLDIEVEPNRPDFLSVFGVAREVSAATGVPLLEPDVSIAATDEDASGVASISLEAPGACPEYLAKIIRGVDATGQSPLRAQARLTASGMRPVSVVVDATNYAMLELGQPLHAFDLHRLAGPGIVVRHAVDGERLVTLDDVERVMDHDDLLICDLERPVAIGGVMGGATSEVSDSTTDVLLESAYFTRTGVLRSARRLGLDSEASHRFERGTDPEGLERGAARCTHLISEWAGGIPLRGVTHSGGPPARRWVGMRPARASHLLGYPVSHDDARAVFDSLHLNHRPMGTDDASLEVEVPGYRVDIEREVDLIEEIARMQGYDRIGSQVPSVGQAGGEPPVVVFRRRLRDALVRAGLREVRLLSFASEDDLELAGDPDAVPIANPLQSDERFLRTRLTPGLLHTVARNQARGSEAVTIFEVGTVFRLADPVDECEKVAFALAGPAGDGWAGDARPLDVLDATGVLEALCAELRVPVLTLGPSPEGPFHPGRSAFVMMGDRRIGVVGELHPRVAEGLELQGRVAVAEVEVAALREAVDDGFMVADVPRFPPVRRDLAYIVSDEVAAGDVQTSLTDAAGELLTRCVLFDVFQGDPLAPGTKSLAFSLEFRSSDRTLSGEETEPLVEAVSRRLAEDFGATLRAG